MNFNQIATGIFWLIFLFLALNNADKANTIINSLSTAASSNIGVLQGRSNVRVGFSGVDFSGGSSV